MQGAVRPSTRPEISGVHFFLTEHCSPFQFPLLLPNRKVAALIPGHCGFRFWFRLQHKLRIAQSAHLRDVQAGELIGSRDALPDNRIDDQSADVREGEYKTDQRADTD